MQPVNNDMKNVDDDVQYSKKQLKKLEKKAKKKSYENQEKTNSTPLTEKEPLDRSHYGSVCLLTTVTEPRDFTHIRELNDTIIHKMVWIRCRISESRCKGSLGFLVLRENNYTVQGVLDAKVLGNDRDIIKWTNSLPLESVVDIYGEIILPHIPILSTSQKVEVHIKKIYCISKAIQELPFVLRDANRKEQDNQLCDTISVKLDTRLDNRVLDLRTTSNFHIFTLQSHVSRQFREFLYQEDFVEIHTPKLIEGAAEGGSSVFTFSYFGNKACLAQSPQLHKQMAICADFPRVFEIGPVFRSENSNTHRHLCEFTGMDFEMVIQNSYLELVDMLDRLLKSIFSSLVSNCSEGIKEIQTQFPATPFQWIENTPKLSFIEGIEMLREAGFTEIPEDVSTYDLSTPMEKELGRLIKKKYNTDFYFLLQYPLKVRPFYTMPSSKDPKFSNSFDVFMRGEEIVSGAQRIHDIDILMSRLKEANISPHTVQAYLNAFKLGVFPHGGCGIGLERVVMLFLGLDNIRRTSMFPRDPKRIQP